MRQAIATSILVAVMACSPARRPVATEPPASERLAVVDAEVRAGCLDCLESAYQHYAALRQTADARDLATVGAIHAAVLIAIRERELGLIDEGYLAKARDLAASATGIPSWLLTLIDIAHVLPTSRGGVAAPPASDIELDRARSVRQNRDVWLPLLRDRAQSDIAAAYTWLALTCDAMDTRTIDTSEIFDAVSAFAGAPLIVFREARCRTTDASTLEGLLAADDRFVDTTYGLGLAALGARPRPHLDAADQWFQRAFAWRPKWPALTLAMGGLAMSAEEFGRAHARYAETLALEPHWGDAMFGDLRALTYLGSADEAIAMADRMIAERWSVGDARYWRAYNELQLSQLDAAWRDIEDAERTLIDAQVPKLAGLIAYRRGQLEVAIARFTTSHTRNPFDCETRFYLGVVHVDLRHWADSAQILTGAAACLQNAEVDLAGEIERIRASHEPEDRKTKQIARREQQIAEGRRRIAASWFDSAIAYSSLSKNDEAREFAEKVADDEQFGVRAKELLARLR